MNFGRTRSITIATTLAVLVLLVGRFLSLDADVPPWFAPEDLGLHLDDGYKSLAARNLVEFGSTHWHSDDDYPGWYRASPLTQRLYRLAFTVGGVELTSIRIVGVTWFLALIAAFILAVRRIYPPWAVASGALLLSLEPMLYHFSRVALFEVPLGFFVSLGCFGMIRVRGALFQVVVLAISALLAWRLVKPSGYLYIVPALFSLQVLAMLSKGYRTRTLWLIGLFGAAAISLLALATHRYWSANVYLEEPGWFFQRLLTSGPQQLTPLIMAAALLCIVHGVTTRPRAYLSDPYRFALISTLLGVPLILAVFQTPPPRFYVAMMPCAPLLVIDHLGRGVWRWRAETPVPAWARALVTVPAVLLAWYLLRSLDYAILRRLPWTLGDAPGVLAVTMYRVFAPVALATAAAAVGLPGRVVGTRIFRPALAVLLGAFLLFGAIDQIRTLAFPTHDGQRVRERVVETTSPEATIGGDWAPLLTLSTGRRCLYVNDVFNRAIRFPELRLDYFLNAGSWQDELNLRNLREMSEVELGDPIPLGTMLGRPIMLHPVSYRDPVPPSRP